MNESPDYSVGDLVSWDIHTRDQKDVLVGFVVSEPTNETWQYVKVKFFTTSSASTYAERMVRTDDYRLKLLTPHQTRPVAGEG